MLDFCGDVEDFRGLFHLLDEAYRDVDSIFMANGLATMSIPIGDVHMREGVDGKYLEFFTYKDLPFGLQDTAQASWDYFKGRRSTWRMEICTRRQQRCVETKHVRTEL